MGVQGLTTLVENHRRIYRDVQFRQSRLLIDGNNLMYLLYFDSGLDQNFGGEYAACEVLIEKFVKALRDCRVEPFVVLDGGYDTSNKKLETVRIRTKERIKKANQAAEGGRREGILPLLVKLVFQQTLARLEVAVAQCYGEADQEIAALAREWECPVLSRDSDFYIFDLPGGLLPISHFQWEAVVHSGSKSYIPCKKYKNSSFCVFFDIQPQLLPSFAALAGNDYVNLRRMDVSIRWSQFDRDNSGVRSCLKGLLCWLKDFHQTQEAFEAALGLMGNLSKEKKVEVMEALYLGIEEYQLPPSCLKKFFIHGTPPPRPALKKVAARVPDWVLLPLTQARLTPDVLDVLQIGEMSLGYAVDLATMPSANLTSRPLRQVMYGLLLGGGRQVTEGDREGLQMKFTAVKAASTCSRLQLSSLPQAEPSLRLQVFLEALGVSEASLDPLPPPLRLPVAATCFWLQRARPPPEEALLKALLLGLSSGDTLTHTAALQIEDHQSQKRDAVVSHAINQWQVCLKDSIHLNQLLGRPLPEPQVARLYGGTLVHQLVHRVKSRGKLRLLPKNDPCSARRYQTMQAVVHQYPSPQTQTRPLADLTANLQQLILQEDEEEAACSRVQEDLRLGDLVSLKTRYRAKERQNRCSNPELARKKECRGRAPL